MINIENLTISFSDGTVVYDSSFSIEKGEIVGVVGESGSGKSMTALAIMGLLKEGAILTGKITMDEVCLTDLTPKEMTKLRGRDITMVFQEPMTSLNPLMKVGKQILEVIINHEETTKEEAYKRVLDIMESVGLKDAVTIYEKYPHQLSGGMRQRVMIAMAIVLNPKLLIADEPTTALDSKTQTQIVNLIKEINQKKNTSVLFITHNLKLAREICDKIVVMNKGRIVEAGSSAEVFENPKEEYTKQLINAIPKRIKLRQVMALEKSSGS